MTVAHKARVSKRKVVKKRRGQLPTDTRSVGEEGKKPRPLVLPSKDEPRSGCLQCPLLAYSKDFDAVGAGFAHDEEKIRAKELEPHTVHTRCVEQSKWAKVDVMFIGEAPGRHEDNTGTPFIGRAGDVLRSAISASSVLAEENCGIANVVRCRPPRNRNPGVTEIRSCAPQLLREIKARKPKVLVALGNVPLKHLTGHTGITTLTGKVLDCIVPGLEHYKVVACLHPAYVLRADHEMIRFIEAIEVVQGFLQGTLEEKPGPGEYKVIDTLEGVTKLMRRLRKSKTPVGVDTETGSLSPWDTRFPNLLCFSFSPKAGVGYTVPFDHDDSPWRWTHGDRKPGKRARAERGKVKREIRRFLESNAPKVLQNAKFDAKHIRRALGCEIRNYVDTTLIHLVLDERRGTHSLKTLAFHHTGMGGYETTLDTYVKSHKEANPDKDGGSYANIPGEILFPYAGMDADVTVRVLEGLRADPEYPQFEALSEFLHRLSPVLLNMEYAGAQVDAEVAANLDRHYSRLMRGATKKIHALKTVKEFSLDRGKGGKAPVFNPGSHEQLQDILFGYYGETPVELTDKGFEVLTLRYERRVKAWRKKRAGPKPRFQWIIRESIKREEWRNFSTKADVLQALKRKGNELAPLILEYRAAETLWKTFARPLTLMLDENGRVHGTYNILGTVTGRLASHDPNLQNIPNKGGGLIKGAYVSRFGVEGLLGQVDYSQIELRVAASWFNEPSMIRAYVEDQDLHRLTALDITGMTEAEYADLEESDPHKAKEIRTEAKRINFGCVPLDTIALTRRGWKAHDEIEIGDEVLGYRDGASVWTRVTGKVRHELAPVARMGTKNLSFETTLDHRWVAQKRVDHGSRGRRYETCEVRTSEITTNHRLRLAAPLVSGCRLPIAVYEAALIGWLVSDGHVKVAPLSRRTAQGRDGSRRKHFGCVYQSKPEGVSALCELFRHVPHTRRLRASGIHEFNVRSEYMRDLWSRARLEQLTWEQFVLQLGTEELAAFVDAVHLGDGTTGRYGSRTIKQNAGEVADAIKLAAHLTGRFISQCEDERYTRKDGTVSVATVLRLRRPYVTGQRLKKLSERMVPVWCLRTETGNWTMLQDGQIMLTGNCLYGGGPPALQTALAKDGVFLSLDECKRLLVRFFEVRPKLKEGIEKLEAKVCNLGYLESFTGRRRRIPEVFSDNEEIVSRALRQSVNFPIQNGASEMTLMSLVLIAEEMVRRGYRSIPILTVHDSIIFDLHVDEAVEVMALAKEIMETLPTISDRILPGLSWSWLKCPLKADCEIGVDWKSLVDFDPNDYDEDELWDKMEAKMAA